jgi:hypothetical protein
MCEKAAPKGTGTDEPKNGPSEPVPFEAPKGCSIIPFAVLFIYKVLLSIIIKRLHLLQ